MSVLHHSSVSCDEDDSDRSAICPRLLTRRLAFLFKQGGFTFPGNVPNLKQTNLHLWRDREWVWFRRENVYSKFTMGKFSFCQSGAVLLIVLVFE